MDLDITWNLGTGTLAGTVRATIVNGNPSVVKLDFSPLAKPQLNLEGVQQLMNYLARLQQIMIVSGQ